MVPAVLSRLRTLQWSSLRVIVMIGIIDVEEGMYRAGALTFDAEELIMQ